MTWLKHPCFNCGHISRNVVQIPFDFTNGGEYRCDDVRACAQRHNEARGLSDPPSYTPTTTDEEPLATDE